VKKFRTMSPEPGCTYKQEVPTELGKEGDFHYPVSGMSAKRR
jgi:hypothetical protein